MLSERRRHDVTPLDDDDAAEFGQLTQREIVDLVELFEAIDVGMMELSTWRGVRLDERERR